MDDLKEKDLALSFILQGYSYSLQLELLFKETSNQNEMEMLIKYIDNEACYMDFWISFHE